MVTFESLLTSLGFRVVEGQWRQSDGLAVAGIQGGELRASFDCGVLDGIQTVHILGSWTDPAKAAAELPERLQTCYRAVQLGVRCDRLSA